jgi:hypothetical protein
MHLRPTHTRRPVYPRRQDGRRAQSGTRLQAKLTPGRGTDGDLDRGLDRPGKRTSVCSLEAILAILEPKPLSGESLLHSSALDAWDAGPELQRLLANLPWWIRPNALPHQSCLIAAD